jgi:ABC-type glycerol-3-phosphate transport system substrate-binding protein
MSNNDQNEQRVLGKIEKKHLFPIILIIGVLLPAVFLVSIISRWPFVSKTIVDIAFAISIPFIFIAYLKASKTMKRRGILYLSISILVLAAAALFYSQEFQIVTLKIVGNSYGGLEEELNSFNEDQEKKGGRIRAELVDDWRVYYNTNKRWEEAERYLRDEKSGIDVIELDGIWIQSAVNLPKSGLYCLDKIYKDDLGERNFVVNALNGGKHEDHLYAIPFYLDVGLFFYRKDILGKIEHSITLEDFEQLIKETLSKDKNKGKEGFIFPGGPYEGLICTFLELLQINGGDLKSKNEKLQLNTDEIKRTIKFIRSGIYGSQIIPSSVFGYDEYNSKESFIEGYSVVMRNWPFVIQIGEDYDQFNRSENIGVVKINNTKPVLRGWHLGIPLHSTHKEEAWELIKYLTSTQEQVKRANDSKEKRFPVDQDAIEHIKDSYSWVSEVREAIKESIPRPPIPKYMNFSKEFSKTLFRILSNPNISDEDIEQKLLECEKRINEG